MTNQLVIHVDDDEDDLLCLSQALRKAMPSGQIQTYTGSNAFLQALAGLARTPNLFIFDLHLPEIDGLELIATIRRSETYASIPIIILSGILDPVIQTKVLQQGGNGLYSKPSFFRDWQNLANQLTNQFDLG